MDAVDAPTFERITRVPGSFNKVVAGVRAARDAGLTPLKINCVLLRGFNDNEIEGFARFAREEDVVVRFIEFMPLEEGRLWTPEIVVPLKEIVDRIGREMPLVPMPPREASETARRYTFADGVGEIGIIAPVSQAFCGACSRVRLTSDGKIRTCLFSQVEHDLYGRMRAGEDEKELSDYIVEDNQWQRGTPPYRRARIPEAIPLHGPHRRLKPNSLPKLLRTSQPIQQAAAKMCEGGLSAWRFRRAVTKNPSDVTLVHMGMD